MYGTKNCNQPARGDNEETKKWQNSVSKKEEYMIQNFDFPNIPPRNSAPFPVPNVTLHPHLTHTFLVYGVACGLWVLHTLSE
jgi:hypothetical protein